MYVVYRLQCVSFKTKLAIFTTVMVVIKHFYVGIQCNLLTQLTQDSFNILEMS